MINELVSEILDGCAVAGTYPCFQVDVTPKVARRWLQNCNNVNRTMRERHVRKLRKMYDEGHWELTSDAIGFDTNFQLTNGQHRLSMVSGLHGKKVVKFNVTFGLTTSSRAVTDYQGLNRSLLDCAKLSNYIPWCKPYHAKIAKAMISPDSRIVSPVGFYGIMDFIKEHRESIEFTESCFKAFPITESLAHKFSGRERKFLDLPWIKSAIGNAYEQLGPQSASKLRRFVYVLLTGDSPGQATAGDKSAKVLSRELLTRPTNNKSNDLLLAVKVHSAIRNFMKNKSVRYFRTDVESYRFKGEDPIAKPAKA